jgi:hypothetical protein
MEIPLLVPQTAFITIEGIIDISRLQQDLTLWYRSQRSHTKRRCKVKCLCMFGEVGVLFAYEAEPRFAPLALVEEAVDAEPCQTHS